MTKFAWFLLIIFIIFAFLHFFISNSNTNYCVIVVTYYSNEIYKNLVNTDLVEKLKKEINEEIVKNIRNSAEDFEKNYFYRGSSFYVLSLYPFFENYHVIYKYDVPEIKPKLYKKGYKGYIKGKNQIGKEKKEEFESMINKIDIFSTNNNLDMPESGDYIIDILYYSPEDKKYNEIKCEVPGFWKKMWMKVKEILKNKGDGSSGTKNADNSDNCRKYEEFFRGFKLNEDNWEKNWFITNEINDVKIDYDGDNHCKRAIKLIQKFFSKFCKKSEKEGKNE